MRKRKWILPLIIGVVALGIVVGIFVFKSNNNNGIYDHISEIREVVYKAEIDGNKMTAISGEREVNYAVDGKCNGTADFLIITVEGKFVKSPEYCVEIDGSEYAGTMQKHPFNDEYSCEINARVNTNEFDVKIKVDNDEKTVKLHSIVTSSFITAQDALEKSRNILSIDANEFDGEIYVRLIENPLKSDDTYYWYVAYYFQNDDCKSVLFDALSGEAVAVKND